MEIERELLEMYRDPTLDEKPALLANRGGAFYSEAAAQLIASLHDGSGDVQVVDVRNDGALPDLPDDAVVEIPARIDRDGAHPLAAAHRWRPSMRGLVQAGQGLRGAGDPRRRRAATGRRRAPGARSRTRWSAASRSPGRCWTRCSRRTRGYLPRFATALIARSSRA